MAVQRALAGAGRALERGCAQRRPQGTTRPTMAAAAAGAQQQQQPPQRRRRQEDCYVGEPLHIQGAAAGPLAGLTAVVKDCFDVAGLPCTNGSPAWLASHPPAAAHAAAVQSLLGAGATVIGKNVMDEMAYSLAGENAHYGTPTNPAAPGRIPGGSSSGTAAAVAAGDADVGLGGDTGGSVRVPAGHCGILGMRPTWGRVSLAGGVPLAPSFDTGGWFARDAAVLRAAGAALLDPATRQPTTLRRLIVASDAFALAQPETAQALYESLAAHIEQVSALLSKPEEVDLAASSGGLTQAWFTAFRVHQGFEIWRQHGAWVMQQQPSFGPGVRERFELAAGITQQQFEAAAAQRATARQRLADVLGADGVLLLPTAPGAAPLRGTPADQLDAFRTSLISLTCIGGLSGFPQVNLPVAAVDGGLPVGLGLLGPPGSDEDLLALAEQLMGVLQPPKAVP